VLRGFRRGGSRDAIHWLRMRRVLGLAQVQGCEPTRQLVECLPQLARRVVLGGGVPLVRPQEELLGPRGYTSREGFYFEPRAGGKLRIFGLYNNKQTNKQTKQKQGKQ